MYHTTQTYNLHFDLLWHGDLELTWDRPRLRNVQRVLDTIHAVLSALFQPDTAILPGEASDDIVKNLTFDRTRDVISDFQIKFYNMFGKLGPDHQFFLFLLDGSPFGPFGPLQAAKECVLGINES